MHAAEVDPGFQEQRLAPWARRGLVAMLLLLQVLLLVDVARRTGCTVDEHHYFNSGRILARHGFAHVFTTLQGPLPLRANQLFVGEFPDGGFEASAPDAAELLFRGRLATLLFVVPATWLVYCWSRRLFGDAGALLSLTTLVLNPLWLAYGGILLVDAQHASVLFAALYLCARHLERPSSGRLAIFAALGAAAVATKYLAILALLPAALLACGASVRAAPRGARWRDGAKAALVLGVVGLLVLHACYRLGPSTHVPAAFVSEGLRALEALPVLGRTLVLLPGPLLEGIDYQLRQGEGTWRVFLDGERTAGSALYYVVVFLRRTPELVLLALVPALALLGRARPRSDLLALLVPLVVMLLYLSLATDMQLGVRYALVWVPALCLLLGALGTWRVLARRAALGLGAAAVLGLGLALDLARNGSDWLAYFNAASGGQDEAYLHFRDTNCDFGQHEQGLAAWLEQFAPRRVDVLGPKSGARFGLVAVRPMVALRSAWEGGPLDWALIGEPVARLGAAYYVFDVTRAGLEAELAAADTPGRRRALTVALLAEGERDEARRVAAPLELEARDPLRRLLEPRGLDESALSAAWAAVGREDLGRPRAPPRELVEGDGPLVRAAREKAELDERFHALLAR